MSSCAAFEAFNAYRAYPLTPSNKTSKTVNAAISLFRIDIMILPVIQSSL